MSDRSALTGVNGRELSACSTRQKVVFKTKSSVRETTSTEDGVKYSLKTSYQPLPDATLVWRTGRIEPPLNAFVGEFHGDVDGVPLFDVLA